MRSQRISSRRVTASQPPQRQDDAIGAVGGLPRRSSSGQPLPVSVLVSGEGTNLQALLDRVHGAEAQIVAVGSSRPGARALERAAAAGGATGVVELATYA